ncbi:DsrE family protein [Thiohalophilus sp.]|uniref:DsrE family protein n=1 Tax=Thiohalophilus sp. TaxID=3028392 RepID=UPI002ACDDAF6|nr:DsrE family protein [Thiohalophilus sp.]MDZ7661684.1 DsrE family protein [Thiohalophilus sp.]
MRTLHPWLAAILLAFAVYLVPVPSAQAIEEKKVAYHADFSDPRRFSAMLTSINNMVTTYKSELLNYDIRIVFVAHGIRFLTDDNLEDTPFEADSELRERRQDLSGRLKSLVDVHNVKLELCNITRSEINLSRDKLYDGVEMVQSGVVRLTELQEDGFAYLKIE